MSQISCCISCLEQDGTFSDNSDVLAAFKDLVNTKVRTILIFTAVALYS